MPSKSTLTNLAKGSSSNKGNDKKNGHLRKERIAELVTLEVNIRVFPSSYEFFTNQNNLIVYQKIIAFLILFNVCRRNIRDNYI